MIPDLDQTLKQLLTKQVPLDPAEVEVTFDLPGRDWSGGLTKPTINLYLYDLRENQELRDNDWIVERGANNGDSNTATKKRPPLRIDLSYLVTAWTTAVEDEHRLVWRLLPALLRHPVLPRELLQGEVKETVERLDVDIRTKAAQPDGVFKDPGDFWSAIENQLKPSINYVVTVPLDLEATFTSPLVLGRTLRAHPEPGAEPDELIQIAGTVRVKGKRGGLLAGANVSVLGRGLDAETDAAGRYTLRHLPPGKHTFRVSASGRKAKELSVTVPAGDYDLEV